MQRSLLPMQLVVIGMMMLGLVSPVLAQDGTAAEGTASVSADIQRDPREPVSSASAVEPKQSSAAAVLDSGVLSSQAGLPASSAPASSVAASSVATTPSPKSAEPSSVPLKSTPASVVSSATAVSVRSVQQSKRNATSSAVASSSSSASSEQSSSSVSIVVITSTGGLAGLTERENFGYSVPIMDRALIVPVSRMLSSGPGVVTANLSLGLLFIVVLALCSLAIRHALSIDRQRVTQLLMRAPLQALLTWIILQMLHLAIPSVFAQGMEAEAGLGVLRIPVWGILFFLVAGATNIVFDSLLIEEGKTIDAFLAKLPGVSARQGGREVKRSPWLIILLILTYGLLGAYLNSQFSLLPSHNIGMILVAVVTVMVAGYAKDILRFIVARRWRCPAWFQANIIGLIVALLCVAMSRELGLSPGFLYGLPVGLFVLLQQRDRAEGVLEFWSFLWMLTLATVAGLTLPFLEPYEVLWDFNALIFVILVEGVFLELLPLPYLGGGAVFEWKKTLWALEFLAASFLLFQTLFNPQGSIQSLEQAPPTMASLLILGVFVVGIFLLWVSVLRRRNVVLA